MLYKAIESFVGKVSMVKDEVKDITDEVIAKDLLHAGYIIEVPTKKELPKNEDKPVQQVEKPVVKAKKPATKKTKK